eukprot:853894-Amphidinium_carterae.3
MERMQSTVQSFLTGRMTQVLWGHQEQGTIIGNPHSKILVTKNQTWPMPPLKQTGVPTSEIPGSSSFTPEVHLTTWTPMRLHICPRLSSQSMLPSV